MRFQPTGVRCHRHQRKNPVSDKRVEAVRDAQRVMCWNPKAPLPNTADWAAALLAAADAVDPMRQPVPEYIAKIAADAFVVARPPGSTGVPDHAMRAAIQAADAARLHPKRDPLDAAWDVWTKPQSNDDRLSGKERMKAAIDAYNREVGG